MVGEDILEKQDGSLGVTRVENKCAEVELAEDRVELGPAAVATESSSSRRRRDDS